MRLTERILRAATVVLHREGCVYLVRRAPTQRYFPDVWAFPGGKVDGADGDGDPAFRTGAARELQEETGLRVDLVRLVPAGRLLTPPFGPVRFDTQFFLCSARADEEPRPDPGELVDARWSAPADAIAAYERGDLPLAPPTLAVLRLFAAHGIEDGARAMASTDGEPHHRRFRIEVHPGVYALPLKTRTLPPATTTNAAVFAGERVLVVDPGPSDPAELAKLEHLLDGLAEEGRRVAAVALTHHHHDHVGGAPHVAKRYGAEVLAHADAAARLPFPVRAIDDGHEVDLGGRVVRALHTPGHAPGHLAFRDARRSYLAAGDLVSGVSTILVDPEEGDMAAYMESLARCAALEPAGVLPAHGPPQSGGAILHRTLEHRRMREGLVLEALTTGAATARELLPSVYADADPGVWPLAERNLEAHLVKLERERKAKRIDGRWSKA